jgi:hypothetical protein
MLGVIVGADLRHRARVRGCANDDFGTAIGRFEHEADRYQRAEQERRCHPQRKPHPMRSEVSKSWNHDAKFTSAPSRFPSQCYPDAARCLPSARWSRTRQWLSCTATGLMCAIARTFFASRGSIRLRNRSMK